jgi:hypothetical protein
VDNVEHLFVRKLPQGRYDLQVLKNGGTGSEFVSPDETYSLAFEFFSMALDISPSGPATAVITWPIYPAGFVLESTPNLRAVPWSLDASVSIVTNGMNRVTVNTFGNRFFRLRRP